MKQLFNLLYDSETLDDLGIGLERKDKSKSRNGLGIDCGGDEMEYSSHLRNVLNGPDVYGVSPIRLCRLIPRADPQSGMRARLNHQRPHVSPRSHGRTVEYVDELM